MCQEFEVINSTVLQISAFRDLPSRLASITIRSYRAAASTAFATSVAIVGTATVFADVTLVQRLVQVVIRSLVPDGALKMGWPKQV